MSAFCSHQCQNAFHSPAPVPQSSAQPSPSPELTSPSIPSPAPSTGIATGNTTNNTTPAEASVASLSLKSDRRFLTGIGDRLQLQVSAQDAQGKTLKPEALNLRYISSRPEDISVDDQGNIIALKDFGYANIRVEISGQSAVLLISVNNPGFGGGTSTNAPSPPQLNRPSSAVKIGNILTLSGKNLNVLSGITIDGTHAPIVSQTTGQIQVRVPATARAGLFIAYVKNTPQQTLQITLANRAWFVDDSATGQNNGDTWADAFNDLQSALAVAQNNDEVWVAEGRYTPSQTGDRTVFFNVPAEVSLYGGFAGGEAFLEERDVVNQKALLSGDLSDNTLTLRNSIIWDNEATPLTLESGTLTSLYSIIKDLNTYTLESGSTGNISTDPNFLNLIDLDGPDNILGTRDDGISLGIGSPAINLDTSGASPSSKDITGRRRDAQPDAGAYERLP